jgi:hypothetical protein
MEQTGYAIEDCGGRIGDKLVFAAAVIIAILLIVVW